MCDVASVEGCIVVGPRDEGRVFPGESVAEETIRQKVGAHQPIVARHVEHEHVAAVQINVCCSHDKVQTNIWTGRIAQGALPIAPHESRWRRIRHDADVQELHRC